MTSATRRLATGVALVLSLVLDAAPQRGVAQTVPARMRLALTELGRAAYQLSIVPRDREAHRARALTLTNEAISEVRAALAEGVR